MTRIVLGILLVAVTATPAHAQVRVDIGIHLPGPPTLVVVPGAPVYWAPGPPVNLFFYANQYWVFASGAWYSRPTWNGPWVAVQPAYVPGPILRVPVRYYRVPPPRWKAWRLDAAPHWEPAYGRDWHEQAHERNWREGEERWSHGHGKGCPPGLARQGRC